MKKYVYGFGGWYMSPYLCHRISLRTFKQITPNHTTMLDLPLGAAVHHTLEDTQLDLDAGHITVREHKFIQDYIRAAEKFREVEQVLSGYLIRKYLERIKDGDWEYLGFVRNELRYVPECSGKDMLFAAILKRESNIPYTF